MSELARVAYQAFAARLHPPEFPDWRLGEFPDWRLVGDSDRANWQRCADAVARQVSALTPVDLALGTFIKACEPVGEDSPVSAMPGRDMLYAKALALYEQTIRSHVELRNASAEPETDCIPHDRRFHERVLEIARFLAGES